MPGPSQVAVIMADDLRWLDELTLALVHYLVRAAVASATPLLVVVAAQPIRRPRPLHRLR